MAVLRDLGGWIVGGIDDDLLRQDGQRHGTTEVLDEEIPALCFVGIRVAHEGHQVQAREIAGRVVQEHVFGARVARVDATRLLDRVPAVDGRVVLDAGITANVRGFGHIP